ncbi:hypothetical protein MNBD_GAMMA05-1724 [hydrothermal vent metagenome]|uniref:Uncharacterized protein n=1 Tax=hydrothermal vent metagenome TaxID=652676 RepID=A0A3B0WKX7_9ZZZZ
MTQLRKEISSIKSQRRYTSGNTSATGEVVNAAGKVVMDKAADRAVQELFKYLF